MFQFIDGGLFDTVALKLDGARARTSKAVAAATAIQGGLCPQQRVGVAERCYPFRHLVRANS